MTKKVTIQARWKLKDGSYVRWEPLLEDSDLQKQLVAKAAFQRAVAKVKGVPPTWADQCAGSA